MFHLEMRSCKRKKKKNIADNVIFPKFKKNPCSVLKESATLSLSLR